MSILSCSQFISNRKDYLRKLVLDEYVLAVRNIVSSNNSVDARIYYTGFTAWLVGIHDMLEFINVNKYFRKDFRMFCGNLSEELYYHYLSKRNELTI